MKMKIIFSLCLFACWSLSPCLHAQQLSPQVISTSGAYYSGANASLSQTVGEMAAIQTYSAAGSFLTQGFQQPWDFGTSVEDDHPAAFSMACYPNPSDGNFYLLTRADKDMPLRMTVTDITGTKLLEKSFVHSGKVSVQSLDLTRFPAGTYILSLLLEKKVPGASSFFVQKISIVK